MPVSNIIPAALKDRISATLLLALSVQLLISLPQPSFASEWNTYMRLGERALDARNFPDAQKNFDLAIKEAEGSGNQLEIGVSLYDMGELYRTKCKYPEAEQYLSRAIKALEKTSAKPTLQLAVAVNELGDVISIQGRYAEAIELYKRELQILDQIKGPKDQQMIDALEDYASTLYLTKDDAQAEAMHQKAKEIRMKHITQVHPESKK